MLRYSTHYLAVKEQNVSKSHTDHGMACVPPLLGSSFTLSMRSNYFTFHSYVSNMNPKSSFKSWIWAFLRAAASLSCHSRPQSLCRGSRAQGLQRAQQRLTSSPRSLSNSSLPSRSRLRQHCLKDPSQRPPRHSVSSTRYFFSSAFTETREINDWASKWTNIVVLHFFVEAFLFFLYYALASSATEWGKDSPSSKVNACSFLLFPQ